MNHKSEQSASGSGFTGWEEQPRAGRLGQVQNLRVPLALPVPGGTEGQSPGTAPGCPQAQGISAATTKLYQRVQRSGRRGTAGASAEGLDFPMPPESVV